jgi:hypothetical protein
MLMTQPANQLLKPLPVVPRPPFEGKLPEQTRRGLGGDQGCLNYKCTGAAHGIDQGLGAVVAGQQQNPGG